MYGILSHALPLPSLLDPSAPPSILGPFSPTSVVDPQPLPLLDPLTDSSTLPFIELSGKGNS